jgi:hypothetical protein
MKNDRTKANFRFNLFSLSLPRKNLTNVKRSKDRKGERGNIPDDLRGEKVA